MTTPLETKIERATKGGHFARMVGAFIVGVFIAGAGASSLAARLAWKADLVPLRHDVDELKREQSLVANDIGWIRAALERLLAKEGIQSPALIFAPTPAPPPPALGPVNDRVPRRKVRHGKPPETGMIDLDATLDDGKRADAWDREYGAGGQ